MAGTSFTINWPSEAQPAAISKPFDAASGTLSIAAPSGTVIKAGAAGKVIAAGGTTVQINSGVFTVAYVNLKDIKVQAGEDVNAGTAIGASAGPDSIQLTVFQTIDPTPLLVEPAPQPTPQPQPTPSPSPTPQPTPSPTPSGPKLYIQPTSSGVRIREKPVDGTPLTQVGTADVLEVIEPAEAARKKVGVEGQWINVRTLTGISGYTAGQFYAIYTGPEPKPLPPITGAISGLNLDMYNKLGRPSPDRLKGIGWIRVKFNVSFNPDNNTYGNTDINATFNRVKPFIEPFAKAGIKVLMVFTHQLYGEGAGYHWPSMDRGRWLDLIPKYSDYAKRVAGLFANTGLISAYQIWNEQDTNPGVARAAVPVPPLIYGIMLTQAIQAIRSVDKTTPIITGGHVRGPDAGSEYIRKALAEMPGDLRPDGIASHPYGRGVKGNMFSPFGALEEEIRKYAAVLPGKPVWLTEWGVLDRQGDMSIVNQVTDYAAGFMNIIKTQFQNQVAAAVWYAWADGMDNGYGLVDKNDKPKQPLYDRFKAFG